jgi:hypothetical protein
MSSSSPSSSNYNNKSEYSNSQSNNNGTRGRHGMTPEETQRTRNMLRNQGLPAHMWEAGYHYRQQLARRKARAESVLKYPSMRQLKGNLSTRFKSGNIAIQIHRPNNRREYMKLSNFNARYGTNWKSIGANSDKVIRPNTNLQRSQIKVVKFFIPRSRAARTIQAHARGASARREATFRRTPFGRAIPRNALNTIFRR